MNRSRSSQRQSVRYEDGFSQGETTPRARLEGRSSSSNTATRDSSRYHKVSERSQAGLSGGSRYQRESVGGSFRSSGRSAAERYTAVSSYSSGVQTYSRNEIIRNRIIAAVIILIAIVLLFNLISCAVRAIAGPHEEGVNPSDTSMVARVGQSVSTQTAAAQARGSAAAAPAGVDDPWLASGKFTTGDAELDQMIKEFCDANTQSDMSQEENAFTVYCRAMWTDYLERDDNQEPTGPNWDIQYAKQLFTLGTCNCYEQAAAAEYILKYFGYEDATAEPCLVLRQSGTYGDHGLVFVTDTDGRKCLCDPSLGSDGWMLDADIYHVMLRDIGQDPAEFEIAEFDDIQTAPWI